MEGNVVRRSKTSLRKLARATIGVCALFCVPLVSLADLPIIGVGAHLHTNTTVSPLPVALLSDMGVTSFRDDFHWAGVEVKRGVLAMPGKKADLYAAIDAFAGADGALLILDYGNRWYGTGGFPRSAEEVAAFARYAGFVTGSLKSKVRMFEVWNEWNVGVGSKPRQNSGDAAEYVALLRAASAAIRRSHPNATVVAGAAGLDYPWVKTIVEKGALNYSDAISIHPYVHCNSSQTATPEAALASLDKMEALLTSAARRSTVPIYVTEIGWPTDTGRCSVTTQTAANYLVRFYVGAATRSFIKGVWWYDLFNDGPDAANREHNFGLMTFDKRPKPAFHAMRSTTALLKSVTAATTAVAPQGVQAVILKNSDGSSALVTWSDSASGSWSVAMENNSRAKQQVSWRRLATEGAPSQSNIIASGNRLNVRVSAEPVVISGRLSEIQYSFVQAAIGSPPKGAALP